MTARRPTFAGIVCWIPLVAYVCLMGFATIAYLFRPSQVVRSRRLNLPAGHNQPGQPRAGI